MTMQNEIAPLTQMDLLMDVELPVLVRFGSTRMLLRDLMELQAGSVIEFSQPPEAPVEVLVNGRVVARGIAVVVQGNYGVRISEIVARQDAPFLAPDKAADEGKLR
jgi:flagellar motor switch protein FliN/FliY